MKIYCDCGSVISDSDPYDGRFITKEDYFELQRVLQAIIEDLKESIEQYPEENANRFIDRASSAFVVTIGLTSDAFINAHNVAVSILKRLNGPTTWKSLPQMSRSPLKTFYILFGRIAMIN